MQKKLDDNVKISRGTLILLNSFLIIFAFIMLISLLTNDPLGAWINISYFFGVMLLIIWCILSFVLARNMIPIANKLISLIPVPILIWAIIDNTELNFLLSGIFTGIVLLSAIFFILTSLIRHRNSDK